MSAVGEEFIVYRCSECGSVTDPRCEPRLFCSGNQNGPQPLEPWKGDHPAVEMDRLRVQVVESQTGRTGSQDRDAEPNG